MFEQNQELQLLIAFIAVILLAQSVNFIHQYWLNKKNEKLVAAIVPPTDDKKKYETWLSHFEFKLTEKNPLGFKALANPWDDNKEFGIPNREELVVLQQMLAAKGFTSHINKSIEFPPHLTISWN